MKTKLFFTFVFAACLFVTSCTDKSSPEPLPTPDDPTRFNGTSIVGIWACIASDNATYDFLSGQTRYYWNYDPDAPAYNVNWYFNIKNNSRVEYVQAMYDNIGVYRKEDGYLHISPNSEWRPLVDANYIFDEAHQAIRCPSGKVFGFTLESTATLLGHDTIFYVKRYDIDEAAIMDNTGMLQSQYVVRVKGIKEDL